MKYPFCILVFMFSFQALAESSNATLQLRAFVPEKTRVKISVGKEGPSASIESNLRTLRNLPKIEMKRSQETYLVSVTQP